MRRGRLLILLILIVVVGLAVVVFAFSSQIGGVGVPSVIATETVTRQVYFAEQNIPQGTVITEEMLGTFSLPPENIVEVMFEVGEERNLIDQTALFDLAPGTLITSPMVGSGPPPLAPPSWSSQVPVGMVAVSIPTTRLSTAAYAVNKGAKVNVIVCMTLVDVDPAFQSVLPNYLSSMQDIFFPEGERPSITIDAQTSEFAARQGRTELDPTFQKPIYVVPSETQRPRLVCQIILQDVLVLNLGNFPLRTEPITTAPSQDPNATVPTQTEPNPDIITLAVNPQDSISLNYFVYSGAVLTMTLRNPDDTNQIIAESATLTSVLTQHNISLPSKLPYAQNPRIDFLAPPLLPNDINQQPQQ